MRLSSILSALALSVALAACGGSGSGDDIATVDARAADARVVDAPGGSIDAPSGANALGTVCSATMACPTGNMCTGAQGVGSTTMGWCSPMCTAMGGECAAGYTGPAGGMPACILRAPGASAPSLCAIVCTAPAQCPSGTQCIAVPGQSFSVCAPPA